MPRDYGELTTTEVAERLKASPSAVINWVRKGYLHARFTSGNHRRFQLADVEAFEVKIYAKDFRGFRNQFSKPVQDAKLKDYIARHGIPIQAPNAESPPARNGEHVSGQNRRMRAKKKSKPARKPGMKPAGRASK